MAATLLGLTLQLTQGQYSPFGVAVMGIALVIGVVGTFLNARLGSNASRRFLLALILCQFFVTIFAPADDSIFGRGGAELLTHLIALGLVVPATILIARRS